MTVDLDAIAERMNAADAVHDDDPRLVEILADSSDDVAPLLAEVRRLTEENQQLRERLYPNSHCTRTS